MQTDIASRVTVFWCVKIYGDYKGDYRPLSWSDTGSRFVTQKMGYRRGRLNQWHTGHVPGARDFFLFEEPPSGCGRGKFPKLIVIYVVLLLSYIY